MIAEFRKRKGSAISELGPALFLLFLVILFPLLDLIVLGLTYCSCTTLNDLQADKAALLPKSQADSDGGPIKTEVPSVWQKTGFGSLVKLASQPTTQIDYEPSNGAVYVVVSTTCVAAPFLAIPFIPGIPAVSAPVTFTLKARRVVEDPTNLNR